LSFFDLIVDRRGLARFMGRTIPCAIGKGGIVHDKREGDGGTPVGSWQMESVFYQYNEAIRLPASCSHERMRRGDTLYDIVVVLDHNRHPPKPGEGSAIFVHCWRAPRFPTAGCIAFTPANLMWILERWERQRSRVLVR